MNINLITVIVLSYKNLIYLEQCMDSILEQTYQNIEIIIGDDGTPEFNENKILNYLSRKKQANIKSVKVYHNEKNLGVIKNYNKAIKMSNGDYIFYIGMDDKLWCKDTLKEVVDYFESTGALIFTGYRDVYNQSMDECIQRLPEERFVSVLKENKPQYLYKKLLEGNFIAGSCTPFSKKLIEKYGYIDEDYVMLEDWPRYLQLTRENCNIYFINKPLIKYRLGGITTNNSSLTNVSDELSRDFRKTVIKEKLFYVLDNMKNTKMIGVGRNKSLKDSIYEFKVTKYVSDIECLELDEIKDNFIIAYDELEYEKLADKLNSKGILEYKNFYCFNIYELLLLSYMYKHTQYDGESNNKILDKVLHEKLEKEVLLKKIEFISRNMKNKKIIGFGTSGQYKQNQEIYKFNISYFIDNNADKNGKIFDGKIICSPNKLLEENRNDVFIVVFSQVYYGEIRKQLRDMSYCEYSNFYSFSVEELRMLYDIC